MTQLPYNRLIGLELGDAAGFVPVVRRLEAKFRKPASSRVAARAAVADEEVAR